MATSCWFSPSARSEETFRRTLEGARVVLSLRLDKGGYAKHGTGIAVRMLVIDKVPGDTSISTINRASVILANIYLHELDLFMEEMKARYDRGNMRALSFFMTAGQVGDHIGEDAS